MSHQRDQFLEAMLTFVRGMFWHDIAKPLYLGNPKHAMLGYILLHALQREGEALVALLHTGPEYRLPVYWAHKGWSNGQSLPSYLALPSALDVLASVSYSLEAEDEKTDLHQPSAQNSFSRLPLRVKEIDVAIQGSSGNLAAQRFRPAFLGSLKLSEASKSALRALKGKRDADLNPNQINTLIAEFKGKQKLWEELEGYQILCGERTYPSENDTALREHARLSAALAYVLYANLLSGSHGFLSQHIVRRDSTFVIDGYTPPLEVARCRQGRTQKIDARVRDVLSAHLGCQLVRVCFTGLQDLFDNAVRLDDLTGVRELLKPDDESHPSLKTAFKQYCPDTHSAP